ncbi:DNA polymerase [Pacmanvirus S19]|nr:DNA polymerase [Pacmanvirus S19]
MEGCSGDDCQFINNVTHEHLLYHIKNKIPTKINYKQIHLLPNRNDFLDPKLKNAFSAQIKYNRPVLFMPNDIVEKNDWIDGVSKYRVYMFGVLPCGSKTCVVLDNIEVHVDIMVPYGMTAAQYDDILRGQLTSKQLPFTGIADIKLYRLHGFQKEKRSYKRVYFNNLQDRKKIIEYIRSLNKTLKSAGKEKIETASDDVGRDNYYFPKVAREFKFATADWNRIEEYCVANPSSATSNCSYVLKVNVQNFKKLTKEKRKEYLKPGQILEKVIERDSTMVGMWDIETHRKIQNGVVPTPEDTDYTIFMMCSAYFWHHSDEPLFEVCAVDRACNARPGVGLVIECESELNVLKAHMEAMYRMAPDITGAFNGGNFDWPLYKEKLRRAGLLTILKEKFSSLLPIRNGRYADTEESVAKWCFRSEEIKIDAETRHHLDCVARFPGMLDTDVLPVFLKLYPRAEVRKSASLNFFLAKNKLESKEDMPYKRMFKIYERACKLMNIKSCHCGTAQEHCGCCKEKVKEIDFKPLSIGVAMEGVEYSTELYDDLAVDGVEKCCYCGKLERNKKDMADVGYYCVIDCVRPQQLYVKRTIVPDKRELSTMSYVSLYDSFYRADGMKVRNVIGKNCFKRGIAFSNARSDKEMTDKDHYPGAWVFPPNRGLHSDGWIDVEFITPEGKKIKKRVRCRPITGLDFASLYPSLMMTYNLSPDTVVYTKEEAEKLRNEGYSLYHIEPFEFERGEKKGNSGNKQLSQEGWAVRHNGIFNTRKDKNIVTQYVKYISFTCSDPELGPLQFKFKAEDGPTEEQKKQLEIYKSRKQIADIPIKAEQQKLNEIIKNCPEGVKINKLPEYIEQKAKYDEVKKQEVKVMRKVIYDPVRGREALPGEGMGLFPTIVKKLFDKRVPIKAEFVHLSEMLESMENMDVKEWTVKNPDGSESVVKYEDIEFSKNKVESKQKAIKVLANTFYGESGNFKSSVYELLVAAGITCAGQANIKRVAGFVQNKGFIVHYGDTDSLYLSCPDSVYTKCDEEYERNLVLLNKEFEGVPCEAEPGESNPRSVEFKKRRVAERLKWWNQMVAITMDVMNTLKEEVSDFLLANNETCFLNMAYEEVGYPTVFCGKKKYFMTAHLKEINFYPKELFIRGIDIIKQGQAKISKQLGEEFMREALSPENERELIEIAEDKIRKFYRTKLDPNLFSLIARYKPNKRNVPVLAFVARMREIQAKNPDNPTFMALYEPPEAGDKFEYILVKKEQRFTLQGNKIELKKGDQMEYLRVYKASQETSNPMEINLSYYMKNSIVGLFARFIAYHPRFQPPEGTYNCEDKEQYKEMDKHCVNEATKYLNDLCDSITGFNKGELTQRGRDYRKIYKQADKKLRYDIASRYGGMGFIIHSVNVHNDTDDTRAQSTRLIEQLKQTAESMTNSVGFGKEYMKLNATGQKLSAFKLKRIYKPERDISVSTIRINICNRMEQQIIEKLYQIMQQVAKIVYKYEKSLINLIDDMRKVKLEDDIIIEDEDLDQINTLSESDRDVIQTAHNLLLELVAVYKTRNNTLDMLNEIELARANSVNEALDPQINVRNVSRLEARKAEIIPEYEWN